MLYNVNSLNPHNNTFRKLQHRKVMELSQGYTAKNKKIKNCGARMKTQAVWLQSSCLQSLHETVFHYILISACKPGGMSVRGKRFSCLK